MQLGPSENLSQPSTVEQSDQTGTIEPGGPVAFDRLIDRFKSPNALLFFGVLLLVIIMMRSLRKNFKTNAKRANAQRSPKKHISKLHETAQATMAPAYKVMNETEEMARRLSAALDNKAARLELLIEEADAKLATLNRSLGGLAPKSNPEHADFDPIPEHTTHPAHPSHSARTIDPSLLDRARLEQDHAERQSRVAGRIEHTPQESHTPDTVKSTQSIQAQVIDLANAGLNASEIAHKLNEPVGQVELILNLRKQQG